MLAEYKCVKTQFDSTELTGVRTFLYGVGQLIGWAIGTLTLNTFNLPPVVLQLI